MILSQKEQILRAHLEEGTEAKARALKGFTKEERRLLMEEWVVGDPKITGSIKDYPGLIKLAKDATKDQRVQKELNHLIDQLSKGNLRAGLPGGPGHIEGTNIFYLRGKGGARLYYRQTSKGFDIVGKSAKGRNQDQVRNKLKEIYSN